MSTLPSPILPTGALRPISPVPLSTIASHPNYSSNSPGSSTSSRQADSAGARDERSRALQPKQILPAHPMAAQASTKAMEQQIKASNKTAAMESSVGPQKRATAHSKMQKHSALRIESFSSKESHVSDDEDEHEKNTLPLSSTGRKGKSSTVSSKSSKDEEHESEGSSSEDGDVDDKNDSGKSEGSDKDPLADLNGPDEKPFTADHFEDDEQEKAEREWQPEDVPRDGRPPRSKWPTVKYANFLRLRLPDLHEKLVLAVPGIGAAAAVRLSKRGIDTVRYLT